MAHIVRVAAVQYPQKQIRHWGEFEDALNTYAQQAAAQGADFLVFPELFTLQLLSAEMKMLDGQTSLRRLSEYSADLKMVFQGLAHEHQLNVIAGTHLTQVADGTVRNISMICLRNGGYYEQQKLHITPKEQEGWQVSGGDAVTLVPTEFGPVGVLICYDSEFPEQARALVDGGALILFVPFCTDDRQGYLRVRYSCQARAVENQCYVVLSGNVGHLPNVHNMETLYGQGAILTPSDMGFPADGIAAEAPLNEPGLLIADLNLGLLRHAREVGQVRNLADRRKDLYEVRWQKPE